MSKPLSRKFRRAIRKCNKYTRKTRRMTDRLEKLALKTNA
jgi:hypothetical protein